VKGLTLVSRKYLGTEKKGKQVKSTKLKLVEPVRKLVVTCIKFENGIPHYPYTAAKKKCRPVVFSSLMLSDFPFFVAL